MDKLTVNIINRSPHPMPEYKTPSSAGMDIRAWTEHTIDIKPMQRVMVRTGIYIEMPEGIECQVRPRSGLAVNKGITVLNTPGTIDADYRGEICVVLVNLGTETEHIGDGERIAQLVFAKHERVELVETDTLGDTERGDGGFGHTGMS